MTSRSCRVAATALLAVLLVAASILPGCSAAPAAGETWTVALYLCGSNLESKQGWATKTLEELASADMPGNVTVVVHAGGARSWKSEAVPVSGTRLEVRDGNLVEVGQAGDASMGEAETLSGFLEFVQDNYPADHTCVVLWDHGGGPLKGACFDELYGQDALSLPDLDESFAAGVRARGGAPYDLVGLDACLMGSLETAYLLRDDAQWMVASEEIEAGAGWDYQPLLDSLGSGASARDAGVALCDGYLSKSAERRKDASVTLSVVDLSKVEDVVDGVSAAIAQTEAAKAGDEVAVLRAFAYGVRQAESFGGASENEGRTNLVDLLGLVDAAIDLSPSGSAWTDLQEALEQAISYNVCGKATSGANGLSLWYPVKSTKEEIDEYAADSPLVDYANVLSKLFDVELGDVSFLAFGPLADDGGLTATIDSKSADAFCDIYVRNWSMDGTYADTNVDLFDDWDRLSFTYHPGEAVGITLDGMVLDANVVDYGVGYQVFSSPVRVNGKSTNLRTCWIADKSEDGGGHYELLGTWDGIDDVSGLSDRSLGDLEAGDVVEARSSETDEVRESIVVEGTPEVSEALLSPGKYECQFVAIDLLGNEYPSDVVAYEIAEDGSVKLLNQS